MTTVHTRQIVNKNAHREKQNQVKKILYIVFNIFFHHVAHMLFTPVLHFSPLYHICIPFPLNPVSR